mgnify:CR=1 FL=1
MYSKYVLILITIAFSFNFSFEQTIKSYGKATGYVEIDESYDDVLEETIDRAITIAENKALRPTVEALMPLWARLDSTASIAGRAHAGVTP